MLETFDPCQSATTEDGLQMVAPQSLLQSSNEIPAHPVPPIILTALLVYFGSIWPVKERVDDGSRREVYSGTISSGKESKGINLQRDIGEDVLSNESRRQHASRNREEAPVSAFKSLLTGVPSTTSKAASRATIGVNIFLSLLAFDFILRGLLFYPTNELSFSRVGYVSSTTAKILVREPKQNLPLRISYQELSDYRAGPAVTVGTLGPLDESTDFTYPVSITGLNPSTKYRWRIPPDSPANIPWIHTLDDHEIANDWASGNATPPYPAAVDPYLHYHVNVNPPIPEHPHSIPSNTSYFSFINGPASFFLLDTRTYRSEPSHEDSSMLGFAQLQALIEYILRPEPEGVKWKIITSSVPFTKNWHVGTPDTWGGFLKERRMIFEATWKAELELGVRIVLLSGDRHEFAATRFPDPILSSTSAPESFSGAGRGIHEFCVGPLSQFYLPVRSYHQEDDEDVAIKYVPDGNFKFGLISIKADEGEQPTSRLTYSLYVNGKETWRYTLETPLAATRGRALPPGKVVFDYVDNWEEQVRQRAGKWAAYAGERSGWLGRAMGKAWDEFLRSARVDEA
ncbi:hypothetical protein CISG_00627 [Coccidioides immitis RMSCC 3703]|uniref:PhoD-like phosphatase metallophosphatase domain-containing protein n=1 Tax=Coccidioides immitis RMSCC 3703 TaxID=454286 RepID=A0A0J8TM01_COCIT|nr:hypothetical protein CISG_00627 [Coccidioides immitis RMSCC 3703]